MELIIQSIGHLDPLNDRPALLALLRVSSGCWDAAARMLYRNVRLNQPRFALFLAAGRGQRIRPIRFVYPDPVETAIEGDISHRTRRAFTYMETLHLVTPLASTDFTMLWDAAARCPGTVLFPNVRHLRLDNAPGSHPAYRYDPPEEKVAIARATQNGDVALFSNPDVCVCGDYSYRQVFGLLDSFRTFTVHGMPFGHLHVKASSLSKGRPQSQLAYRIFHPEYTGMGLSLRHEMDVIARREQEVLAASWGQPEPTIEVECILGDMEADDGVLDMRDPISKRLPTQMAGLQVTLYSKQDMDECPPCAVCREYLEDWGNEGTRTALIAQDAGGRYCRHISAGDVMSLVCIASDVSISRRACQRTCIRLPFHDSMALR